MTSTTRIAPGTGFANAATAFGAALDSARSRCRHCGQHGTDADPLLPTGPMHAHQACVDTAALRDALDALTDAVGVLASASVADAQRALDTALAVAQAAAARLAQAR